MLQPLSNETLTQVLTDIRDDIRAFEDKLDKAIEAGSSARSAMSQRIATLEAKSDHNVTYRQMVTWIVGAVLASEGLLILFARFGAGL